KPVNMEELLNAAERALEHRALILERRGGHALLGRGGGAGGGAPRAGPRALGPQAHSRRVRGYSLTLARAHGMTGEADLRTLEHGVLLHDIGKIGIPDAILLKPGPLTPAEWKIMRSHPEIGRQLVEQIAFLRPAVPIVYHHHERWDGTGYPQGLKGEAIPLGARIFAVAD